MGMIQIMVVLNSGNVEILGGYFDEVMEFFILEEEGIYNKSQVLQKVKWFLFSNKVSFFIEVYQGVLCSSDLQYVIGDFKISGGIYCVYLFLINSNGKMII